MSVELLLKFYFIIKKWKNTTTVSHQQRRRGQIITIMTKISLYYKCMLILQFNLCFTRVNNGFLTGLYCSFHKKETIGHNSFRYLISMVIANRGKYRL